LNRYFDGMVDIVNRYEGTVNKYNGDNIMVLWGAPLELKDQARKAVQCALEMQRWIVAEREKGGGPDISFGFGINTGGVVAGFLGAKGRMEYTVIGDTANVASRLTSSDIARRDQVACSGETLGALGDDVEVVDLGSQAVDAERCTVYIVNYKKKELWARVAQRTATEIRLPLGQGLAGHAALTGETVNVPDAYADARFDRNVDLRTGFRTLNMLVVPVWGSDNRTVVGVIQALNKRNGAFERRDQMLLEQIGDTVGPVLEHIPLEG